MKRSYLKRKGHGYSWGAGSALKRSRLRVRKYSKNPTEDGASLRELKDEMDGLVRTIIAARDRKCVNTGCNQREGLHVGHYITRKVLALRWRLDNVFLQCDFHNELHQTDRNPYFFSLLTKRGAKLVAELERIATENPRLTYVELLAIRDGLRAELALAA